MQLRNLQGVCELFESRGEPRTTTQQRFGQRAQLIVNVLENGPS